MRHLMYASAIFPFARLLHASFELYQISLGLPVGDCQLWGWTHSLRVLSLNPGQCMIYEDMRGQVDFQMMEILGDKLNCKWWKCCQSTSVLINDGVRSQRDLISPDDSLVGFYKLAVPSNLDRCLPCCQIIKLIWSMAIGHLRWWWSIISDLNVVPCDHQSDYICLKGFLSISLSIHLQFRRKSQRSHLMKLCYCPKCFLLEQVLRKIHHHIQYISIIWMLLPSPPLSLLSIRQGPLSRNQSSFLDFE